MRTKPRHTCPLLILVLLLPISCLAGQLTPGPLTFGLLPSRSAVSLFKHYAPLREYLTSQLKRDVVLETAVNYPAFLQHTQNRKYDFVLTAPHFALLAIESDKYSAPVTYTKALMADILVPKYSTVKHLRQLAGQKIAIPPESAIVSMAGIRYLEKQGLSGSLAPQYVVTKSHNASIHAMLAGDTLAAVASVNVSKQFIQQKTPVRKIATTSKMPSMAVLVARDLPEQTQVSFIRALTRMNHSLEGNTALKKMGYPGYRRVKNNEFETARPYLKKYHGR